MIDGYWAPLPYRGLDVAKKKEQASGYLVFATLNVKSNALTPFTESNGLSERIQIRSVLGDSCHPSSPLLLKYL